MTKARGLCNQKKRRLLPSATALLVDYAVICYCAANLHLFASSQVLASQQRSKLSFFRSLRSVVPSELCESYEPIPT